jgi:predicted RNA binding protein YcfA (HicA-like mRNA interferase family)
MSKLPAVKPRDLIKFLEQNGFVLDHVSGSHYIYYHSVSNAVRWYPVTIAMFPEALFSRS